MTPADGTYLSYVFPVTLLIGTGAGLCFPALMTLAMSGATSQDAGLASGLVNTTAQVGGALGLAVLATVSASRTDALIAHGRPVAVALTDGYHLAFWIAFGLVVAAIAVAATVLRPQHPAAPPVSAEATQQPTLAGAMRAGALTSVSETRRHDRLAGCPARSGPGRSSVNQGRRNRRGARFKLQKGEPPCPKTKQKTTHPSATRS